MTPNPEIQFASLVGQATHATPNSTTTTTIVSAPGAGFRLRLFHASMGVRPDQTGNVECRVSGGGTMGVIAGDANGNSGPLDHYPQGIPLPEDTALQIIHRSEVAGQTFDIAVHYVSEAL
jgi:hypothetical protein